MYDVNKGNRELIREKPPWTVGDMVKVSLVVVIASVITLGWLVVFLMLAASKDKMATNLATLVATFVIEMVMVATLWWLIMRKYRCGWQAIGFRSFSFREDLNMVPLVIITGFLFTVLYTAIVQVMNIEILIPPEPLPFFEHRDIVWYGFSFLALAVAPLVEESFFRGFIYPGVKKRWGVAWGVLVSSFLFAVVHAQIGAVIPIFFLGMLLAWLYSRTGSLWPSIITHFLYNGLALIATL